MKKLVIALLTLLASALLLHAEVTGTWIAQVVLDAGSGTSTFVFQQTGETLSGTYEGVLGMAMIKGKVTGTSVEWSFNGGEAGTVSFKGTLDGEKNMKGSAVYGMLGSGSFTATKK